MQINFILQGKGGVGKSYVATLLAQNYTSRKTSTLCIDTDPVNQTFSHFSALKVQSLEIMEKQEVNPRKFDDLVTMLVKALDDTDKAVIDNGSTSFSPLCKYMVEQEVVTSLKKEAEKKGKELNIFFHTVVTGGAGLVDTAKGLEAVSKHFPENQLIIWINEYFGKTSKTKNSFTDTPAYKDLEKAKRIYATITLPALQKQTFGYDLEQMLSSYQTFDEAINNPEFNLMAKQRLALVKRNLFAEIEKANL